MNLERYCYKTELHLHTAPASPCSEISPLMAVEQYAALGYHSIVISNHFYPQMRFIENKQQCISAYLEDYKLAAEVGKKCGINVILGCEIRFIENCNDYLLFGIDEDFFDSAYDALSLGIKKFSQKFQNPKHMLIQAHPFRDGMIMVEPQYLDGIEVFNMHPNHNSRVAVAAQYAKKHDLIATAGTDFHHPEHQGLTALLTDTELKDSHDIVNVLRSRDYLLDVGGFVVLP